MLGALASAEANMAATMTRTVVAQVGATVTSDMEAVKEVDMVTSSMAAAKVVGMAMTSTAAKVVVTAKKAVVSNMAPVTSKVDMEASKVGTEDNSKEVRTCPFPIPVQRLRSIRLW